MLDYLLWSGNVRTTVCVVGLTIVANFVMVSRLRSL